MAKLTYTGAEVQALLDKVNDLANLTGAVTIEGDQAIEGLKDFINGFLIGGALVKYDAVKKCFIFTENVLFEKGAAWNSRLEDFTKEEIFSITKAVDVDWETIGKRADGKLYVIPNGSAGGGNYDPDFLHNYLINNIGNYAMPLTGGTVNGNITATGNVTALIFNGKHNGEIYLNNSGGDAYLPLIFSNSSVAGSPRYNYLFTAPNVDVGINPYRGTLKANSFIGALQGNADSATKLATPRTIWGQTFDGTSDITYGITIDSYKVAGTVSSLSDLGNVGLVISADSSRAKWGMGMWTEGNGQGYIQQQSFSGLSYALCLQPLGGNVAIGGTKAEEKLHVYGNILTTGNVSAQSLRVNGSPKITYDAEKNVLVLPCNVLIERGVAWNSSIDGFNPQTITQAVSVDGTSIIRDGGVLRVNPDYIQSVGGLDENELHNYLTNKNYITSSALEPYATTANVNSLLTGYLPKSGGTVNGNITATGNVTAQIFNGKHNGEIYLNNSGGDAYLPLIFSNSSVAGSPRYNYLFTAPNVDVGINPYRGTLKANSFIGALQGNADTATKLATSRLIFGNIFNGESDIFGAENAISILDVDTNPLGSKNWSEKYSLKIVAGNNAMTLMVGNATNERKGMIQVGHSAASFSAYLGELLLNPLGGNVAIGGKSAGEKLHVHGNILATGRIAWNSSRVLKDIIGERYLTLEELAQIKPYQYKWKDRRDNFVHAGAIADEVMDILPETVLTDTLGIHSMDYAQTAFVMAASLTPHVSDHERRIKELETENVALKREIEKLKRVA